MPLYMKSKDVNMINSLNNEIINKIIDTEVNVYKLSLYDTEEDLYGESLQKIYFPAVQLAGLIEHDDEAYESDEFGPDATQTVTFNFHRQKLEDINLYPEISDIIEYNNKQFMIDTIVENQFLGGQTSLNHSIICSAHLTKNSATKIDKIKRAYTENINSLYK